jgi:hypothetical protein
MLTTILIFTILNLLLGLYNLACMNGGFKFTNVKIDGYAAKNDVVINAADKVIGAHKKQVQALIDEGSSS